MRLLNVGTLLLLSTVVSVAASFRIAAGPRNADSPNDSISGEWDGTFFVTGHITPFVLDLKLEGENVSGKVHSDHTGAGTVNGTWKQNVLDAKLEFEKHETILLTGELKEGKLVGEFRTEGFVAKWEAKRKAAKTGP